MKSNSTTSLWSLVLLLFFFCNTNGFAQKLNQDKLEATAQEFASSSLPMLRELLSIPNDAFYPEDIEKNVKWCESAFKTRGFNTTRIETETVTLLLAERKHRKAKKTVLIYLQIDGQPIDSTRWFQESAYLPALK